MSQNEMNKYMNEKDISLFGIFGVEAMELLTAKLSEATGFSFTVIDYRGNSVTDSIICNSFCRYHQNMRECAECQVTAAFASAKAAIKCCPYLFACPLGLYSIAVPIIVNDQYLGAVVGGRVRSDQEVQDEIGADGDLSYREEEDYMNIPVFSREKMMAIGDLMFFMLREMGEKETMGLKLSTTANQENELDDLRRWNIALRNELKEAELRHLRSHIHPQFLLNMFETVANYAILEDAEMTQNLIVDYASIMRYYLDESAEYITIEDEFAQIEKYLAIFKSQYENKFHYHIKMDENVKQIRFPVLILFPLLGYVINYGAFSSSFNGILFVDVEMKGDQCLVTMQLENHTRNAAGGDHGPGRIMNEEMIQKQLAEIKKRLAYVYGDKYILDMKPNMIMLRFPGTIPGTEVRV